MIQAVNWTYMNKNECHSVHQMCFVFKPFFFFLESWDAFEYHLYMHRVHKHTLIQTKTHRDVHKHTDTDTHTYVLTYNCALSHTGKLLWLLCSWIGLTDIRTTQHVALKVLSVSSLLTITKARLHPSSLLSVCNQNFSGQLCDKSYDAS